MLDLDYLDDITLALGTDGLSSNNGLNMFNEMRNAFFIHTTFEPNALAQKLLIAATNGGAKALGLKKGILKKDFDADIISFTLPDICSSSEDLAISVILHTHKITNTYIKGIDELNK
jgi:cytosine/adenosine deaminase-related metal-dependent hydrolase